MNDELKKILEDIDNKECYYVWTNGCLYQDLTKEKLLLIKDCITSLQQRIDNAIEYCDEEIRNIIANFDYIDTKDLENIRNILKGESDE